MLILVEGTGKYELEPGDENKGYALVLSHCSWLKILDRKRPMCWSIVVKEKPTIGSLFLWGVSF